VPISNELPSSWWSPEIGLHLLLRAHISPEPIIGIQRLGGLGKGRGIGILEVPKLGSWFFIAIATIVIVVVVVGGNLGEVLESGEVGLAFGVCGFTIL
jgi:hypothetical protein